MISSIGIQILRPNHCFQIVVPEAKFRMPTLILTGIGKWLFKRVENIEDFIRIVWSLVTEVLFPAIIYGALFTIALHPREFILLINYLLHLNK